jgi:uncharacterized protein (UPF0276 family)
MTSAQPAVGLLLNGVTTEVLAAQPNAVDFVEAIPEMLWVDRGRSEPDRFGDVPTAVAQLASLAASYPIVGHGVGLSIGSSLPIDTGHVRRVREWLKRWQVGAFSEHLGFARVRADNGEERHAGLGFPLPCDEDVLTWLTGRVRRVMDRLERPILLENGVRHTPIINEDMGEPEFMNRLAASTGCGMLLDLHNLYTDYRNHGWHPFDYLEQLDPAIVRELHIAGGSVIGGAYTDSHSGRCPTDVWDLLAISVTRFPDVERVTFEFNDSYYSSIGRDGVLDELAHARSICDARVAV